MDLEEIWGQQSVPGVLCECVLEHGVEHVTMAMVVRKSQLSRATFYRLYPSWRDLVAHVHARAVQKLNDHWPLSGVDRRLEFEAWWSLVGRFLRTRFGRAFLAMRPHVATLYGMHEVEHCELAWLTRFVAWAGSLPVARTVWLIALAGSDPNLSLRDHFAMRELAWTIANSSVGLYLGRGNPQVDFGEELDLDSSQPLAPPICEGRPAGVKHASHEDETVVSH